MKQLIALFAFVALATFAAQAQNAAGPVMTFESTTIDYGVIEKGAEPKRVFKFTNTGNEPLTVKNAKGSCGCTVPTWPKEPIMPGETGVIEVRYDTNREGVFTKNVTLDTNEATPTHSLTIKGEVKQAPKQESVPAGDGGLQKQ